MTREEAVARIKDHIEVHRYHERNAVKIFEALDMAIKALEQPEIIRCEDCAKCQIDDVYHDYWCDGKKVWKDHFCGYAERRIDE